MTWFRVDDGFYDHPKVAGLPMASRGLWVTAGAYCARHLTDGHISRRLVRRLGGKPKHAAALVAANIWTETADGWKFRYWRREQDSGYRPKIPIAVRAFVMQRDGFACVFCTATESPSLDHIIRYRDGGPDTVENLRVLCMPCNLERG